MSSEWTSADLERLRALDGEGLTPSEIAARLKRDEADVEERLAMIRAQKVEPTGPDEEGETSLRSEAISDDPAAWVHTNDQRTEEGPTQQTPPPPD